HPLLPALLRVLAVRAPEEGADSRRLGRRRSARRRLARPRGADARMSGASAVCATHREATAVATCARCGRFLCDACAVVRGEETYCDDCLRHAAADAPARISPFFGC